MESILVNNLNLKRHYVYVDDFKSETDLKYKFGVISDIHLEQANAEDVDSAIGTQNGVQDFKTALRTFKQNEAAFIAITGDIGMRRSGLDFTSNAYLNALNELRISTSIALPVRGNHDQGITDQQWTEFTKQQPFYNFERNSDLFIFLSNKYLNADVGGSNQTDPFSSDALDFLERTLASSQSKVAFVFMHFPLNAMRPVNQYAGLQELYYPGSQYCTAANPPGSASGASNNVNTVHQYGFQLSFDNSTKRWHNAQNERILEALRSYAGTTIVFNGHTHYEFNVDLYSPNVTFSKLGGNAYSFHVPSLNYPRNRNSTAIANAVPSLQPSQGYFVERHDDSVVVKGYEFNPNVNDGFDYDAPLRKYVIQVD